MLSGEASESSISRVVISDAALPFVARGGRLFSGQVIASDPGIEDGEQVLVVDKENRPVRMVQIYKES
jgi:archaeosine-15-forming tRNA-guanine transglycosylase